MNLLWEVVSVIPTSFQRWKVYAARYCTNQHLHQYAEWDFLQWQLNP
jgi:hypothetical protein